MPRYLTSHRITIVVHGTGDVLVLLSLDFHLLSELFALQFNVDVNGRREEVRHYGGRFKPSSGRDLLRAQALEEE